MVLYTAIVNLLKLTEGKDLPKMVVDKLGDLLVYPHQWIRQAACQLVGQCLSTMEYNSSPTRDVTCWVEGTLSQLRSENILPEQSRQITRNLVWLTCHLLLHTDSTESSSDVTGAQIVHKIVAMAGVEASQAPKISTKREITLKWIGGVCKNLELEQVERELPAFLTVVQREMKNAEYSPDLLHKKLENSVRPIVMVLKGIDIPTPLTISLSLSPSDVTGAQIVHKIVAMAGVEASQAPKISTKREITLKWIGGVCKNLELEQVERELPAFLTVVQREMKNADSDSLCSLAIEVMEFLRGRYGKDTISSALVSAEKQLTEKRKKRKREAAISAIADPAAHSKKKIKSNLAKREKRKEKVKVLKAKQYKKA
eukprot:sb/3465847/